MDIYDDSGNLLNSAERCFPHKELSWCTQGLELHYWVGKKSRFFLFTFHETENVYPNRISEPILLMFDSARAQNFPEVKVNLSIGEKGVEFVISEKRMKEGACLLVFRLGDERAFLVLQDFLSGYDSLMYDFEPWAFELETQ